MQTIEKLQAIIRRELEYDSRNIDYQVLAKADDHYWAHRILAETECAVRASEAEGGRFDDVIAKVVDYLYDYLAEHGAITKDAAYKAEHALMPSAAAVKAYTVHCVAHAHIDMNWMWGFSETTAVTLDTFRTMLDLMKEYPQFTFSQSQASTYRMVERYDPEMLDEIRARVKEGRWEVTASSWVEADKNMPNGESFARHALYAKRYMHKLFGVNMEDLSLDFEPDTFGHNWNTPEICAKSGIKYYYHHRAYDGHYVYRWQSPSGAEVIVFREPKGYNAFVLYEHLPFSIQFCNDNHMKDMLLVYGVGDHGGGPTRRDIERILDMSKWPIAPTVVFSTYGAFYQRLELIRELLPVVNQELNFVFTGCYTSQSRIKMSNRIAEDRIYESEALSAMAAAFADGKDNAGSFATAWERILFNQFHDILPGSCVIESREYALGEFQKAKTVIGTNAKNAMRLIAESIDTSDVVMDMDNMTASEGAGAGYGIGEEKRFGFPQAERGRGKTRIYHLFNPTEYDRSSIETITVWDWNYDISLLSVRDSSGNLVEYQIMKQDSQIYPDNWGHQRLVLLIDANVPAFGYSTYTLTEEPAERLPKYEYLKMQQDYYTDDDVVLENDFVRAVFKPGDMRLISLDDKITGRICMSRDTPSCSFRLIMEDTVPGLTAWRMGRYAKITDLNNEGEVVVYEQRNGALSQFIKYQIAFGRSTLDVTVSLDKNSKTLCFDIEADWHELGSKEFTPQLNFYVPFSFSASKYRYDIPFSTIDRLPIHNDAPGNSFIMAVPDDEEQNPLILITDSKYGFRGVDNSLAVSLIRSSTDPDPSPEDGMHRIRLGVAIADSLCNKDVFKATSAFIHPICFVSGMAHSGTLPKEACFLTLEGDVKCSCVKTAEDGDGLIVRLYDVGGKGGGASITFANQVRDAKLMDLIESKEMGAVIVNKEKISFYLPPFQPATLKISLAK